MRASSACSVQQLKAVIEASSITSVYSERLIVKKVLNPRSEDAKFPYVEALNDLMRINMDSSSRKITDIKRDFLPIKLAPKIIEPTKPALELMRRPSVSTPEIEEFLRTNYTDGVAKFEVLEKIDSGISDLLLASTPNNLRTLMRFLSQYWQSGFDRHRSTILAAREQCQNLLSKSLECHPATEHNGGGEQVGIVDMHVFEQFATTFFTYMNVPRKPGDAIDDLLLRLCAKCGTLDHTLAQIGSRTSPMTEETVDAYLAALKASNPTKESLLPVKKLLINSQTGPAAIKFLLPLLTTKDEVLDLLIVCDRSVLRHEIYSSAQLEIIQKVLETDSSLLFPVLIRIKTNCPLSSKTIDAALQHALETNNLSGAHQLVQMAPLQTETVKQAAMQINR